MRTIELGSTVKDNVSGFKGIVTARSVHMNGCDRYWIEPPVDKDGKRIDGGWYDEITLEVLKRPKTKKVSAENVKPGGFPSTIK